MEIALYIALSLLGLILLGNFFTRVIQDLFIFRPIPLLKSYKYSFELPFEELNFETPNRGRINALWFKDRDVERPVILFSHGNSYNLSIQAKISTYFRELGYDTFVYDYRGFGKSKGPGNEENFLHDARAMYDFLEKEYGSENIVLYGKSMGSGVTSMLAAERGAKVCILYTPYHSIPDLFKTYYPFLPLFLFRFKYNFYNNIWLEQAKCPVHIFHGTRDRIIPYSCAIKLKYVLKNRRNFYSIRGGKHNNLEKYEIFQKKMKEILKH